MGGFWGSLIVQMFGREKKLNFFHFFFSFYCAAAKVLGSVIWSLLCESNQICPSLEIERAKPS